MNEALERLAKSIGLDAPGHEHLRLEFGHACVLRVKHFIEEPAVADCVFGLGQFLGGTLDRGGLEALAVQASHLANRHQGSKSIDGAGHAAVSATYAVANALAGKALQAADYAAYAMVYGGAVTVRSLTASRSSRSSSGRWIAWCRSQATAATGRSPIIITQRPRRARGRAG